MKWISLLSICALTACGSLNQSAPLLGLVRGLTPGQTADSEQGSVADRINRDFIESQPVDLLLASVVSRASEAVLLRGGDNGSRVTWLSGDGTSVSFDRGVLIATRGLGPDMMGADVSGTIAGFSGQANYMKQISFLNGLDQIETLEMSCTMTLDRSETITIYERNYDTSVYTETCEGAGQRSKNTYWRAVDGIIWKAEQWISADAGYLTYERL